MLSKVRVAVGKSQLPASDTAAAAGAAWRQLLSKLGPNPEPHLLICGYDGYHYAELLLATLRGLCGDRCSVIGSSCGGGMIVEGVYVTGPCIAIMGIVDPEGNYDVCFAASGEGAEDRVRASIAAANAEATAGPVAACPSSSAHAPASSSASSSSPPFSICLSTSLFTGVHADEFIAGAEAALGRSCSLFGGAPLPFNSAGAQSPDVAASRVFASARVGSDGRPPSMHVGQGVVLALCRPSVHAASAFTSATTPMQCRGKITKLIEGNSTFPGAEMLPVTCIAEIDGRRAFDMYAEWMRDTEWHDEFNGVVAQAKAQADAKGNRNGAMDWFGLDSINNGDGSGGGGDDDAAQERRGTFGVMHGFGLGVMHPTCCAAKGCEGEDFKHFSILGWGPEGEAFTLPGVTPKLGQTVTIMDCPGGMVGARAHTSTVAAKLLHEQGFEVNSIRGAFTFCCGANLQLEGGQGCADLAEKLGDVLGWAPLLGFIGGPELGRMPHGGSEFGTFMYGVVVWSDREQGTSA